jgi:predicted signal transduction protein with EAL and GGDEF domain
MTELLARADEALYSAKERGRNRCEVASAEIVLRLDASTPSLRIRDIHAKSAAA